MPFNAKPGLLRGVLRSTRGVWIALLTLVAIGTFWNVPARTGEPAVTLPAPASDNKKAAGPLQTAVIAGGCFWGVQGVLIVFDPKEISYGDILRIYFSVAHDPTELNRQGPDVGTQYRSAIFYGDASQQRIAQAYIDQLQKARAFARPIVTRVDPLKGFYPAEAYHQDFLVHNPTYPYIVINDLPKLANLKRLFPDQYREKPVLTAAAS